jgi:hypothetical protein
VLYGRRRLSGAHRLGLRRDERGSSMEIHVLWLRRFVLAALVVLTVLLTPAA